MTNKLNVLKEIEIGERVAEDESDQLEKYFLETDQWNQIFNGKIDIVYGPKGSGKSALYTLLNKKDGELFDRNVILSPAESIRGATVFKDIITTPPPSEFYLIYLWKIYGLCIIAKSLREYEINNKNAKHLIETLEKADLLPKSGSILSIFRAVSSYMKNLLNRDSTSTTHTLKIDPNTGAPTYSLKNDYSEKTDTQSLEEIPVEELFEIAELALNEDNLSVWLLFDRLDVAFADSPDLERNALRALFRAYSDLKAYNNIKMKIFVRDDIWQRITAGGFTEASHITRAIHIKWSEESLLNLVMLRLINNDSLVKYSDINTDEVKSDYQKQHDLFYSLVPTKIDTGNNPDTFKWILSRTTDSSKNSVPREVIHLIEEAKKNQISELERGGVEPSDSNLFNRTVFREALITVSKVRYEQTLLAEHPGMREYLEKLKTEKSEQSIASLSKIWSVDQEKAKIVASRLCEIGFFETRGTKEKPSYWVPFLYRHALNLVQGKSGV